MGGGLLLPTGPGGGKCEEGVVCTDCSMVGLFLNGSKWGLERPWDNCVFNDLASDVKLEPTALLWDRLVLVVVSDPKDVNELPTPTAPNCWPTKGL